MRRLPSSAYRLDILPRVLIVLPSPLLAAAIDRCPVLKGLSGSYTTVELRAKAYMLSQGASILLFVDLSDGQAAWDWTGFKAMNRTLVIILRSAVEQGPDPNQVGAGMGANYPTKPVSGEDIARVAVGLLALFKE